MALVRNASDGKWRSLGVVSDRYEAVIRRIVLLSGSWRTDAARRKRVEFFLPLFGHRDSKIRELAYLEMGRAPYAVVKRLGQVASRKQFAPMLSDPKYIEWRSLAILLLAQSNEPRDKRHVIDSFQSAERFGLTINLSAWTVAAIELQGAGAIEFIEQRYLGDAGRTPKEISAVLKALSLHGTEGRVDLRDRIVTSYQVLLSTRPEFASQVADDLAAWKRSNGTQPDTGILESNTNVGP